MRRLACSVVLVCAASLVGACAGDDDGTGRGAGETVTGRVVSLGGDAFCVSPDRGETRTCIDTPDPGAVDGVDVGECVTASPDLTTEGASVEVVDEAACATGDLGEDAGDRD